MNGPTPSIQNVEISRNHAKNFIVTAPDQLPKSHTDIRTRIFSGDTMSS